MNKLVLINETDVGADWPPSERRRLRYNYLATYDVTEPPIWERLLAPFARQLESSGLGRIVNSDSFLHNAALIGRGELNDLVVQLKHDYGLQIFDRLAGASNLHRCTPAMPRRWVDYHCDEYFYQPWSVDGHLDESSETWVIVKLAEAYEDADTEFLAIGGSGCDGVDFGYRKRHPGLWAYYPIGREFQYMAATVSELAEGWCNGRLSV